jgi:hypothetical protein
VGFFTKSVLMAMAIFSLLGIALQNKFFTLCFVFYILFYDLTDQQNKIHHTDFNFKCLMTLVGLALLLLGFQKIFSKKSANTTLL